MFMAFKTTGNDSMVEHFRISDDGALTATDTSIGSNSDIRLKTNIEDYSGSGLSLLNQLKPKVFDWINPERHGFKSGVLGFIAQDIMEVDSHWVDEQRIDEGEDDDINRDHELVADTDHMAYTSKFGEKDVLYVTAIQELSAEITELKKEIEELKK